jgi:hypothetical protein
MKFQLDSSKPRIFPSTSSPSTGWKFSFWGLVRTGSKRHLPLDHRDKSTSHADLIAGSDEGCPADSRSVGQIPKQHIGLAPDGGVEVALGIAKERSESAGGVFPARGVVLKRTDSAGGVEVLLIFLRRSGEGQAIDPVLTFLASKSCR